MDSFVQGRTETVRWHCHQQWSSMLFGPNGLCLDQWLATGRVQVVKHGPHRSVYRIVAGDREFHVKHFRCHTIWDRIRHCLRHSQARREWYRARQVAQRGIPTTHPVAWQEQKGRGPVGESFLVTESISGTCTLEKYFRQRLPMLPPDEQRFVSRQLLVDAAQFVARIHQAGIRHNDLHPGNLLVSLDGLRPLVDPQSQQVRLHLIDVPGVRFTHALTWPAVRASLVVLNAACRNHVSQTDRIRFLKAYLAARPDLRIPPIRQTIRELLRRTEAHCRHRLRRRDRRTLRTSRDYVALRTREGRAHGLSDLPKAALDELSAAPEALLWQNMHQPVKLDRGSMIVEADLPLEDATVHVAYKRYRPRKWWKAFLAPFRRAQAVRSWQRGHALQLRSIPAPRPIVAVDRRRPWHRCESYLAVQWIEGSENLHLYLWRIADQPHEIRMRQANRCAESLGRLLGRMHAQRVLHGDLKASNLLVTDRDGCIGSHLVDVDDVRLDVDTPLSRRAADLARLAASLEAHPWVSRTARIRFLRAYLAESRGSGLDWKHVWRAVVKRTEPINRRKRRKRQTIL